MKQTENIKALLAQKIALIHKLDCAIAIQSLVPNCFQSGKVSHMWTNRAGIWSFVVRIRDNNGEVINEYCFKEKEIPDILRDTRPQERRWAW